MARLGELGKIITGNTPKTSEIENYISDDICFIKPSDILENDITYIENSEFYISDAAREKARILPPQSILVTCIGIIGKVAINTKQCAFNQQINAIIPDLRICVPNYLAYAIQHKKDEMQNIANAAVVPILNKTQFSEIRINLPLLDEQRRIAAILDKVSKLVFLRKQQLAKLDELVKARFVEMFGDPIGNPMQWKKEPLGNHINVLTGFPFDSTGYVNSGVKICGGLIIMPDTINWSDCKYWPDVIGFENYLLADNDIVIALDRPWISDGFKIAMISEKDLPCLLIQRTARIRAQDMDQLFIYSLLQDDAFSGHCNLTGSLVPHISHKDIKSYPVIVPSIELQRKFASFSRNIKRQKLTIQQSLDKLEALKKSLMQEYFG